MKNLLVYLILMSFSFLSCSDKLNKKTKPENLISQKEMSGIIADMTLTENYLSAEFGNLKTFYKLMKKCGATILKKHHVSQKEYSISIDYYSAYPDKMEKIYDAALEILNRQSVDLEKNK